jgi:hypothetical protein
MGPLQDPSMGGMSSLIGPQAPAPQMPPPQGMPQGMPPGGMNTGTPGLPQLPSLNVGSNPLAQLPGTIPNPGILSQIGQTLGQSPLGQSIKSGNPLAALQAAAKGMNAGGQGKQLQSQQMGNQGKAVVDQFQAQNTQMQNLIKVLTQQLAGKGQSSGVLQNAQQQAQTTDANANTSVD